MWPRISQCIHVRPLRNDAEAAVSSLDHIDVLKARPIHLDFPVSIEKFLLAARLHFETDGIERGHRGPLNIGFVAFCSAS
jgi:hypothetical protein